MTIRGKTFVRLLALLFPILSAGTVAGCDPAYGPVIANATDESMEITVSYTDRESAGTLGPHNAVWQSTPGRIVRSLLIVENGRRREVTDEEIAALSRGLSTAEDALIIVRANSIEVRSLNAARHAGFFAKRQDW